MGVTDEYGCTQYYKQRKDMDMKHKKMEKMIDKYVPMMLRSEERRVGKECRL